MRAFDKKDAEPILGHLTSGFHLLLENGRRLDRREYETRLRESISRVTRTRIEVEALTLTSDEATVLTTEHQTCRVPMAGKVVTMHVVGKARSWWTRTDRGWMMKEAQVLTSDSQVE